MTYEEAEQRLVEMRKAKQRVNALNRRLEVLKSDRANIQSALGGDVARGTAFYSRVERLAIRIQTEYEKYVQALEDFFALEDSFVEAIDTLPPDEKEIITSFYIDGLPKWKVGVLANCSESTVKRYKRSGVEKISQFYET